MRLPTDYLSENKRSTVRFIIVGNLGTLLQYGLYFSFLKLLDLFMLDSPIYTTLAFGLAFGLEMMCNYFCTCYYTFSSKPSWVNAMGFFGARVPNYLIQNGLLWVCMWAGMSEEWSGIWAIVVAGVVNYFLLKVLFRHTNQEQNENISC